MQTSQHILVLVPEEQQTPLEVEDPLCGVHLGVVHHEAVTVVLVVVVAGHQPVLDEGLRVPGPVEGVHPGPLGVVAVELGQRLAAHRDVGNLLLH